MDRFKNTSSHPITLDDGATVGVGEVASINDTSGPMLKESIESGHLVMLPAKSGQKKAKENEGGDS